MFHQLTAVHGMQDRLVHRLDRDASGALVVALTVDAAAWLSAAFRSHSAQLSGTSQRSLGNIGEPGTQSCKMPAACSMVTTCLSMMMSLSGWLSLLGRKALGCQWLL